MKVSNHEQVAKNIKILLVDKGITQQEFANKIGVGTTTVYRLLSGGTDWQMKWAIRTAKIFGVSLDAIFLGKIVPNGEKCNQ